MASLAITADEEKVKWARFLRAGGSLTECAPLDLFVEGMGIEGPFA